MNNIILCALVVGAALAGGCREKSSTAVEQSRTPADAKWHIEHRIHHHVNGSYHNGDIIRSYYAAEVGVQGGFLRFTEAGSGKVRFISGGQITAGEL